MPNLLKSLRRYISPSRLQRENIRLGLEECKTFAAGRLLDIGCGNKPYREMFAPYVTAHFGTDYSDTEFQGVMDVAADATALPFAANSFDTLLCTEVIEHVPNPALAFAEMARVLKPGGYLLLTTPQTWETHRAPYDFFRYTRFGLHHLATTHDLEVVKMVTHTGAGSTIGQLLSVFLFGPFVYKPAVIQIVPALFCQLVMTAFSLLDNFDRQRNLTLGYVMLARKKHFSIEDVEKAEQAIGFIF